MQHKGWLGFMSYNPKHVLVKETPHDAAARSLGPETPELHVPRGMIELSANPTSPLHRQELDPERRIIVYCSSGSRSALAADTLQMMGYENVAHLEGGMMRGRRPKGPWRE